MSETTKTKPAETSFIYRECHYGVIEGDTITCDWKGAPPEAGQKLKLRGQSELATIKQAKESETPGKIEIKIG